MKRSLRRRLSLILGGAILATGLMAAMASFILAYFEAKEFQDDMLQQIAILAAESADNSPWNYALRGNLADIVLDDAESRISVTRLPGDPRPEWLHGELTLGFDTVNSADGPLRVFVHGEPWGIATVVAQSTDARNEIALYSALHTLIPLLLLLPVMGWLIVRIVRGELAPVGRLARHLDAQPAHRPASLSDDDVPVEIAPFVQAINRLLGRITEVQAQQRRFVADAAHELRNPLTALSVQVQNLTQAKSLEIMRERIVPLQAGIERTRKLTGQMLSLVRTQSDPGTMATISISVMARELISEFLPTAEARTIDLGLDETGLCTSLPSGTEADASPPAVPVNLRLVLKNALENSLKYVPDGSEVTLRIYSAEDSCVVEVIDNGPGIPASERERVFDPFYRMPGTSGSGSGLGLAIAREAAGHLGGCVSLHDRPEGSGLVFRYRQHRVA